MRFSAISLSALTLSLGLAGAAYAQTPASPAAAPKDPVVATVNGTPIHLTQVVAAADSLPAQLQQLPPAQLYPLLVDRLVDEQALLIAANKTDLAKQPDVQLAMKQAADQQLENAYLASKVKPMVTDAAIEALYEKDYADKTGPEQVQARQILVKTQAEAQSIIAQLEKGADFATLAQKDSIDPGAKDGGELGWFSKDEMVPAFADAAFALKPGTYTKTPVQTQFGWHVILNEGERQAPPPPLADVKGKIQQQLAQEDIKGVLAKARAAVKVQVFNPDGSTPSATPAAPAKP
ncbi:MAG: peptidylprolyl isomerase [Rhodospirillales bacterium 20-60-12]|nr:MAG: peptidylprolyl isomerase [Rhodospirillales bacterium 20-60-12]HQT65989.1 peptidylprolyl isomerase [Acetobacteraceae bacterium]